MLHTVIKILFFVCVFRSAFTWPTFGTNQNKPQLNLEKLTADVQNAVQKILSTFQPAGQNDTKLNKWMFVVVKQVDSDLLEHTLVAKISAVNDATMTAELVSLADGFHLVIPSGEQEVEREQQIAATAIIKMMMDLRTMERVDLVMSNCSLHSTVGLLFAGNTTLALDEKKISDKGGEYIRTLFTHWLDSIVAVFENDSHLSEEFKKRKEEARVELMNKPEKVTSGLSLPLQGDTQAVEEKIAKEIVNSRLFRKMALNRLFLKQSSRHLETIQTEKARREFLLARTIIDLAKHPAQDKELNKLYERSLIQVAETISESDTIDEMCDKFFTHLLKTIEQDEQLKKLVIEIENKLDIWITFRLLKNSIALV